MKSCGYLYTGICLVYFVPTVFALNCYTCSYTTVETDNAFVRGLLSLVNGLNDEHCKFENPAVDQSEVQLYRCQDTSANLVSRCTVARGLITTTFAGFDVRMNTLSRGCVAVATDSDEAGGGCFQETADDSTAVNFFKKTFETLNLGELHFNGNACFYDETTSGVETLLGSLVAVVVCLLISIQL